MYYMFIIKNFNLKHLNIKIFYYWMVKVFKHMRKVVRQIINNIVNNKKNFRFYIDLKKIIFRLILFCLILYTLICI